MSTDARTRSPQPTPVPAAPARWTVVPEASHARFHVRDKLVTTVHGTMPVEDGGVVVSETGAVTDGWITVSVAGIATGNAHRDRDLVKPRFLDAQQYPVVTITIDRATRTAGRLMIPPACGPASRAAGKLTPADCSQPTR